MTVFGLGLAVIARSGAIGERIVGRGRIGYMVGGGGCWLSHGWSVLVRKHSEER